ncbi:MAG: hypothetical protein ABI895_31235 [Deltaproteobacteria bacterium]
MRARGLLLPLCLSLAGFAAASLAPRRAAAQATSWLYVGGGTGVVDQGERQTRPALQLDTGLGSPATHPLVLGALFRAQAYFGSGVDLALVARGVSRGFARGELGVGLDVGVYQRWWGADSTGVIGNLVLGGPWGLTLLGGATLGSGDQRLYFASVGIDLARLTVHRHSGLGWFANPMRVPED